VLRSGVPGWSKRTHGWNSGQMTNDTASTDTRTTPAFHAVTPAGVCVLCGGTALREMRGFSGFLDLYGHSDARICKCETCSMIFLDPYPNPEQLDKLYSQQYFEIDNHIGFGGKPANVDYAGTAQLRAPKFQATVDLLKRYVPTPARMLDVGAATGEFLSVARKNGYSVAGVEISEFAAEKARQQHGLDVYTGPLDTYKTNSKFDVIHLSHVMEHLVEPHTSISQMDALLAEDGVIYIEVPFSWNWADQLHFRRGHKYDFSVFSVHHRSHFRPDTLKAFFAFHGFDCPHLTLTPPHRYPTNNFTTRAKHAVWQGLSLVGQGLVIEAIFSRSRDRKKHNGARGS